MRFAVTVKPGARREEIRETAPGELRVAVRAPARDGLANVAVIEAVAAHFRVPKSSVRLIHGAGGRRKLLEVDLPEGRD